MAQGLSVSPTSGLAGSSVTVSFTIRNLGGATASASTTNIRLGTSSSSVSTNDPLLVPLNTGSIAAGGAVTVNQTVAIPAGQSANSYYVWVILDANSTAGQGMANEANDRSNTPFTVTAPPVAAPTISFIAPTTMAASTTALTTLTVTGTGFSTSGGYLQFTDPQGAVYTSLARPERIVSVSSTQWVYRVNNGGAVGTWQVRVVNANLAMSNAATFTVQ